MKVTKFKLLGALVALAAVVGVLGIGAQTASAQPVAPGTKSCTIPTAGGSGTCTFTVQASPAVSAFPSVAGDIYRVTITGGTFNAAAQTLVISPPGGAACTVTVTPAAATATLSFTIPGACGVASPAVTTLTVTEAVTVTGAGAVAVSETGTYTNNTGTTVFFAGTATATVQIAAITTITNAGCSIGTAFNAAALVSSANPGQTVTCRIDLNDNEAGAAGTTVASGIVVVTIPGAPGGLGIANAAGNAGSGSATTTGDTTSLRCGAPNTGAPTTQGCDFVDLTFTSTTLTPLGTVSANVTYTPDIPTQNTSAQGNFLLFSFVQGIATLRQPVSIVIACTSDLTGFPFQGAIPGQVGAINVVGIGQLPSTLQCGVFPIPAGQTVATCVPTVVSALPTGGAACGVAPGTIEVSSLNGALVNASGAVSTNLRIACGDPSSITFVNPGTTLDFNTCFGVRFAVAGLGVGMVELRARYEPASVAAAAGIQERETSTNVAFVAPPVVPSLTLTVNPVTVGQTGQALVRFNRTVNCSLAFGTPLTVAAGNICIDPTTGAPIVFTIGSSLNGNVVYTIDNSLVASWAAAQPTAAAGVPSSTAGFVTTANQTIVRCGFFPTSGFPQVGGGFPATVGPLGNFFGGCESVTATYRGNAPGVTNIAATFVPDLPGAFGSTATGLSAQVSALLGLFGTAGNPTSVRTLEVVGAAPVGDVQLARGCNNVSPTVTESASAYAARVSPSGALVAIWEHQAATNTFRGFSSQAGAPNDLAGVTRLKPVFVCVSGAAALSQPPA